jgi:hypothetical protein
MGITVQIMGDVYGMDDLERVVARAVLRGRARGMDV